MERAVLNIPQLVKTMKEEFMNANTLKTEWRTAQLKNLVRGLTELHDEISDAIFKDLGRSKYLSDVIEVLHCINEVNYNLDNFKTWMKDEYVKTYLTCSNSRSKIIWEPLGVVLIMSSWNYPVMGIIQPLAQAIGAGNMAVMKPSEMSPHTAQVIDKLVKNYLDPKCFAVVQGGVEVAVEVTNQPFDLIVYTGSTEKGKLVAGAAAKNLVPCILELGGKSPMIVDEGCDIDWATKRAIFG